MKHYNINNYSDKTVNKAKKLLRKRFMAYIDTVIDEKIDEQIEIMRNYRIVGNGMLNFQWDMEVSASVFFGAMKKVKR